jgi:ASC-1-like (ASCH) protein
MKHELKIVPLYFKVVASGEKKAEVRRNDRNYQVGDHLILKEWSPEFKIYTGQELNVRVTHILELKDLGHPADYVVLSIEREERAG